MKQFLPGINLENTLNYGAAVSNATGLRRLAGTGRNWTKQAVNLCLVLLLSTAGMVLGGTQCFAQATTTTFNYTGSVQTYVVPAGVFSIAVDMSGACGGSAYNCCTTQPVTLGGRVQCTMNVTPSSTLYIYVGGAGPNWTTSITSAGGWNGGGGGGSFAAGGGGASDIRTSTTGYGTNVLVVAGGGGGGGDFNNSGGAGGGTTGGTGTLGACGGGQTGPSCTTGHNLGTQGVGATPGIYSCGGGGGGWWGGNSGVNADGGGGGGSSYPSSPNSVVTAITHTQGYSGANGNGVVKITPNCGATSSHPAAVAMTGGGGYCSGGTGVNVGLAGSAIGVNYQLYRGGSPVGSAVPGVGMAFNFGLQTVAGTYTATATNSLGCTSTMSGSENVIVYTLPNVYTVTGTGAYCSGGAGATIGLSNSDLSVNYILYRGGLPVVGTLVAGTGSSITFPPQTIAGTYTVVAKSATFTGCMQNMSGSVVVSITAPPTAYAVTGTGSYCTGGTGRSVGLTGSDIGVSYQLYYGSIAVGSPVAGTGSAISFGPQYTTGTYTVVGTSSSTGCTGYMAGSALITLAALPTAYTVTGGGSFCTGGTGVPVGLSASNYGINYQLFNGSTPVGAPVAGTGGGVTFGLQTAAGTDSVVATDATTGCVNTMTGRATLTIIAPPTSYTVTGGGGHCSGDTGVHVRLSSSATGVYYQLYLGSSIIGSTLAGTGSSLDFGLQTTAGTYTVGAAVAGTYCTSTMTGSATVSVNPLPTAYAITGGGPYCSGATGSTIGLAGSQTGVNYQLYSGTTSVGSPVAGTGTTISFGPQTTAGTYTVVGTNAATGCVNNMTGSTVISITPLPTAYTVTGGGSYCSGGSGVTIGLSNSQAGVNYQLYNSTLTSGGPVAGTGAALSFGIHTASGTYTVVGTTASGGCTNNMTASATVSVNPLPAAFAVTGGGSYCTGGTGVTIGLSGSGAGVSYQLMRGATTSGSPITGTGTTLSFPNQTVAGSYTVSATNTTTGCANAMTGTVTVSVNPAPVAVTMTGGGGYCSGRTGVNVGLAASAIGVNYQLYRGSSPVGSPVAGAGMALNFGLQTVAGIYTATATNTSGCTSTMSGSATVIVYTLPNVYTVTGTGAYCAGGAGATIGLSNSDLGVNYMLYRGSVPLLTTLVPGTGANITFPLQTTAGTYTVVAQSATFTGCTQTMSGTVTVSITALPTAYTVTGTGSYCVGGTGRSIGLAGSDIGVSYQLYRGATAVGSPVAGTGSAISFGPQSITGTYTVSGTSTATGCTGNMAGNAIITTAPLPTAYTVTGGGSFCSGGTGVPVGLSASNYGVNYQLYNGATPVGAPVVGTGGVISFGLQTAAGTDSVVATDATTGCVNTMTGRAIVSAIAAPTAYSVTGGGGYCSGGTGVHVGLSSSATGVNYQLHFGSSLLGSTLAGTGSAIDFGLQTGAGIYTVTAAVAGTYCSSIMTGSATVSVNPLPAAYAVTGGGAYCTGGTGSAIGLAGSQAGVNYQLYQGTTTVGSPVAGTGSAISFGLQTTAGAYTVVATNTTTSCVNNMTGSAIVSITPAPTAYTVTGGGSYCSGGTGVTIGLSNSTVGVNYQLYNSTLTSGSPVAGTGGAISFGMRTASGTYTVVGTTASGGCSNNMTASATVSVNPLPNTYSVTGGGSYCAGGTGSVIGLGGSDIGVNYQLMRGATTIGSPLAGTGGAISFPSQTVAGAYTVMAVNTATGCTNAMTGFAIVSVNAVPVAVAMTGGGGYCTGGTGVHIGLAASAVGVNYQLWLGTTAVGSPVAGVGTALDFGLQTTAGVYTATASNGSSCTTTMTGSETVTVYSVPTAYTVTGGGSACAGAPGPHVSLSGSTLGVNYSMFESGSIVGTLPGTGAALDFGAFTTSGSFTATALTLSTGCTSNMTGTTSVTINPNPVVSGSLFTMPPGSTTTLTASISGGSWTSTIPYVATIGVSTGLVTGISIGTTVITYSLPTGCWGTHVFVIGSGHRDNPSAASTAAENNIGSITVTPNPNHGTFAVKGSLGTTASQELSIQVTNMLGQVVYENKTMANNGEIDEKIQLGGNIANGMYLLSLRTGSETKVLHIVVQQ